MENKSIEIEGFVPCFDGFYGNSLDDTDFDCLQNSLFDDFRRVEDIYLEWLGDNIGEYIDYKTRHIDISKAITENMTSDILELFPNTDFKMTFEKLISPKEYNFSNDSINCLFNYSDTFIYLVQKYLYKHSKNFEKYLIDNFTDRDGFWSNYSNDFSDWINLDNIEDRLGYILEFILLNNDSDFKETVILAIIEDHDFDESNYIDYTKLIEDFNLEFNSDIKDLSELEQDKDIKGSEVLEVLPITNLCMS